MRGLFLFVFASLLASCGPSDKAPKIDGFFKLGDKAAIKCSALQKANYKLETNFNRTRFKAVTPPLLRLIILCLMIYRRGLTAWS